MSFTRLLVRLGGVFVSDLRMLLGALVIALLVVLRCGTMRLCSVFVMFSSLVMGIDWHVESPWLHEMPPVNVRFV